MIHHNKINTVLYHLSRKTGTYDFLDFRIFCMLDLHAEEFITKKNKNKNYMLEVVLSSLSKKYEIPKLMPSTD